MVFTGKTGFQQLQAPENRGKVWSTEDIPLLEEDYSAEYLCELEYLNPQAVMHHEVLIELADATVSLLVSELSWWPGEVPEDWGKANFTPILKIGK